MQSPNASVEKWDQVLRETGFGGIDFDIYDYEEVEFQSASTIMATAIATKGQDIEGPVIIVHDGKTSASEPWLTQLCDQIETKTGIVPSIESLESIDAHDKICVFTTELERPFLDGIDESSFERMRNLLINSRGVLWLSAGNLIEASKPSFAATQGLLRTLRLEDTSKRYVHLDFESNPNAPETRLDQSLGHIVRVLQQSFPTSSDEAGIECEYAVKDGMLHVARVIPDKIQSSFCSEVEADPAPEVQPFVQPGRPLVWETSGSNMLSDLRFVDRLDLLGDIPSGHVEIESKALGVNFRDVLVALGQLDEILIGHETGGIITRMGPDTEESGLQIGDRVCASPIGRFSSKALAHWTAVSKIPDDMSYGMFSLIHLSHTLTGKQC